MNNDLQHSIPNRLTQVRDQLQMAAHNAGRSLDQITLVGISKRKPPEAVSTAILAGLIHLGENRVQEADEKIPIVRSIIENSNADLSLVTWHMVGRLQSNKARRAVELFDVIQSVDSIKLVRKLSKAAVEFGKEPIIYIEVNSSGEASKAGVQPEEAMELVGEAVSLPGVKVGGLMTVGPLTKEERAIKRSFVRMFELFNTVKTQFPELSSNLELSMGMSGDYKIAINEGATMVRIGTSIFGARN